VVLYDERLTTAEAERRLREGELPRKKREAVVDAVAAAILLDAYLRAQKRNKGR
jgi:putative Holliday junction resolvase